MSTSDSNSNVAVYGKKKIKYDVTKDKFALAPVPWSPTRPQPTFVPGIWEKEEIEDLSRYVDWHRQHPRCITPRPVKENEDFRTGDKKFDEGNPTLIYSRMPGQLNPVPKEYIPPQMGVDCDTDTVSVTAMEREYNEYLVNRFDREDPWYSMSVKDQLEQSHIDGSHTTVKSKRSSTSTVLSAFNKEAAWKKEQYGNYEGGYPNVNAAHFDRLAELALKDKASLHDSLATPKVGPWDTHRDFTQYTKHGTALQDYEVLALERNIQSALAAHEAELKAEAAALRLGSRKSSRKSKKRAKLGKVVPIEGVDQYDEMRHKLGNNKQIEKMTRGFVRLAKKVAKHSKLQSNALETKMDLVEACNKLRVVRVNAMLLLPNTDPDMKTPEEEPILLHMFAKAVRMDQISGHQRLGTEDQDPSDRRRITQVLDALLSKADVNIIGREGITAAHMAAMGDSSKLLKLLADHKADFEIFSTHDDDGTTPLMAAAKYGNVYACADLIRAKVNVNKTNRAGMTALHYAGMFGQTRTAAFLLRIGADKFAKDNQGRTPGRIAMDCGFMATGQTIAAFARMKRDVASQLEYLVEQDEKNRKKPLGLLGTLNSSLSFLANLSMSDVTGGVSFLAKFLYKYLRKALIYLQSSLYDYLEIDYVPFKEEAEDGLPDDDEDEEDSEEADLEAQQRAADAESSGAADSTDNSASTSRRNTASSVGLAGAGAGAGAEGVPVSFKNVDGFQTVGGSKKDNVIGFNDEF